MTSLTSVLLYKDKLLLHAVTFTKQLLYSIRTSHMEQDPKVQYSSSGPGFPPMSDYTAVWHPLVRFPFNHIMFILQLWMHSLLFVIIKACEVYLLLCFAAGHETVVSVMRSNSNGEESWQRADTHPF